MLQRLVLIAALAAAMFAAPARAEWLEARSRHFILYGDVPERTMRTQAEALERLDWGLRNFMQITEPDEIESQKVTVFLVGERDMERLCKCKGYAGFYLSRVAGSIAYSIKGAWDDPMFGGRTVLFHEYAHHFLLGNYQLAFPDWYSEGFAEFASTMRFAKDSATIGYAANHRGYGLGTQRLSAAQLLDPALRASLKRPEMIDAFYGRGWLMTHYVMFNQARYEQFRKYIAALNSGTPGVAAATQAFGDLKTFDRELGAYLQKTSLPGMTMRFGDSKVPPIAIRALSAGEAGTIDFRMQSVRGVDAALGKTLYARAAPVAARYLDDAVVQGWLAEMAFDAGENDAAMQAAERAIAKNPKSVQGLLYRARVRLRRLEAGNASDAPAWAEARRAVIAANRADPDDPEPLWWFWNSFAMEGREPTASAFTGLYRAQELAPQDDGVRFTAATARLLKGDTAEAKRLLRPLAYQPHAPVDNPAARMIAALDAGKKGADVLAAAAIPAKPADPEAIKR